MYVDIAFVFIKIGNILITLWHTRGVLHIYDKYYGCMCVVSTAFQYSVIKVKFAFPRLNLICSFVLIVHNLATLCVVNCVSGINIWLFV